jgi:heat shock protein HspQ
MSQPQPANIPDYFPDELPEFRAGQMVTHRRYGYRGVIVDFDMSCHADEAWYQSNQTQPDRDQPWYHVLVHGSTGNTYVAQEHLQLDEQLEAIDHPLVSEFFDEFEGEQYFRNDQAWPQW